MMNIPPPIFPLPDLYCALYHPMTAGHPSESRGMSLTSPAVQEMANRLQTFFGVSALLFPEHTQSSIGDQRWPGDISKATHVPKTLGGQGHLEKAQTHPACSCESLDNYQQSRH